MTVETPSALVVEPGRLPAELPKTLEELRRSSLRPAEPDVDTTRQTTLFLTVDVEDNYFDRPVLMTGEGIGREYGVFGILDELDTHGLKATFFVNVYEKDRLPKGVVEHVVREIAARGHEVGLHTHPSPDLDFYRRPLFRLSQAEQVTVLRWGADLIARWTGEYPTSFRAGAYAVDEATYGALDEVGIRLDSSCFFPSPNNHHRRGAVNAVHMAGGTIAIPVTTVLRVDDAGNLSHRKLDLDWLSVGELSSALSCLVRNGVPVAMFMMHSFSFIDKQTRKPGEADLARRARLVSPVRQSRYVEVYGPKPELRDALREYLDRLADEPLVQVRTLRDEANRLGDLTSKARDIVPFVG